MRLADIRSVDLNLLVALRLLLDECNISRAAERIGLSQPAMSRTLKRLQATLDDPILIRTKSGYRPSLRATEISDSLDRFLSDLELIFERPTFDPLTYQGEIRIGAPDYELFVVLPNILSEVRNQAPGIRIATQSISPDDLSPLEDGVIDIALTAAPHTAAGFFRQKLFDEELVCAMSADNRHHSTELSLEKFASLGQLVNLVTPNIGPQIIDTYLHNHGLKRTIVARTHNVLAAVQMVRGSDLISTMRRRVAEKFANEGGLIIHPHPVPLPKFDIYQYWHERQSTSPRNMWLRRIIANVCQNLR